MSDNSKYNKIEKWLEKRRERTLDSYQSYGKEIEP